MKALYRHKESGDIFAIEVDGGGKVVSTSGPLFNEGFDPNTLDYDEYWNSEVEGKLAEFEKLSKDEYVALLKKYGFYPQITQRHLFENS